MLFNTPATVPSPPATKTKTHSSCVVFNQSKAFSGGQSITSYTCIGFSKLRKCEIIRAPSLLPDFLFAKVLQKIYLKIR